MRKFFVDNNNSNHDQYIIGYNDFATHIHIVTHIDIVNWYKVGEVKEIINKYNGILNYSIPFFHNTIDAQNFIDDFLIPYEIAFNL